MVSDDVEKQSFFKSVVLLNTDAGQPAGVSRHAGEDGGLLVGVAATGGHKAGHAVDNPLTANAAVQGATRITLQINKRNSDKSPTLPQIILFFQSTFFLTCNLSQPGAALYKARVCKTLQLQH